MAYLARSTLATILLRFITFVHIILDSLSVDVELKIPSAYITSVPMTYGRTGS
jgi:hypothetical protein